MNSLSIIHSIDESDPCGENVRLNTVSREIYYRIKDARNAARTAERAALPGDNIGTSPFWQDVSNLGLQILSSVSKDIEVLAWLAEAELRLRGFAGLRDVYLATVSLLDAHFEALHSIGDDDPEERFAPFAGLNGIGGEGTLIQAIRLTSLVPDGKFGQFSLWDFQIGQRSNEASKREELQQAVFEAGVAGMASHLQALSECISAFDRMVEILDERCGQQAPPSSNTRNALHEAASAIRVLAGIEIENVASDSSVIATDEMPTTPSAASEDRPRPISAEMIRSREEAFELLALVGRYFQRTEPHSPISLSIETLVRRGRMDFSELLAELLPEHNTRNAVLVAAGIQPSTDGRGS